HPTLLFEEFSEIFDICNSFSQIIFGTWNLDGHGLLLLWVAKKKRQSRKSIALPRSGTSGKACLTLGVGWCLAGALETGLLALLGAGIAGQEASLAQLGPQFGIDLE